MNHPQPTVEQFLGTPYDPEEDHDLDELNPIESIAESLKLLTGVMAAHAQLGTLVTLNAAGKIAGVGQQVVESDTTSGELVMQLQAKNQEKHEIIADLESERQTLTQVISDVDAALGKSKAAPALAAKAVIEAWKNPVIETEPLVVDTDEEGSREVPVEDEPPAEQYPGQHAVQPEHGAPVEEWRAYARALGYAGAPVDQGNRSQIRTMLGISQTPAETAPEGGA